MTTEYHYPRIAQVIPVNDMWQEHAGYEETVYIKIFALVIFEELIEDKVTQFTRYLTHDQLAFLQGEIVKDDLLEDSHIADVHWDWISAPHRELIIKREQGR